MEPTAIYATLAGGALLLSIGGAWGIAQYRGGDNSRRIKDLEESKGQTWAALNNLVAEVAEVKGMVKVLVDRTK